MLSDDIGLKALDVESQSKALRIPWITRIITSHGWADIANLYFETEKVFYRDVPRFYLNLLRNAKEIFARKEVVYTLWNNMCIQLDRKPTIKHGMKSYS